MARADDANRVEGVIELFTSQGCSSCPPADRLAGELARDERNLVLTFPVDYWDYLGWKDTLASPANAARQRAYAIARGDRKVYTPQIVVNGREAAVGGDGAAVIGALSRGHANDALQVPVTLEAEDDRIDVTVGASTAGPHPAEVWVFALQRRSTVPIGRGENAGRTVTYANVVRKMTRLGAWDGAQIHFEIPAQDLARDDVDGLAVLVQSGNGGRPGQIVGAAHADRQPTAAPGVTSFRMSKDPL